MTWMCRRPGALAALVAAAAFALAACGGSSSPQVASLGTSPAAGATSALGSSSSPGSSDGTGGTGTSATLPGDVTGLLNEWGACERSNGDPQQADPTVDANGVIWIFVPKNAQPAGDLHELTGTCSQYLAKAQNELRAANPEPPPPDAAEYLKWVNCVRANGVPDYPYPIGDTTNFQGSGVDPNSPSVQKAGELCGKKLGLPTWWVNGSSIPGSVEVRTVGESPNPTPSACFYQKVNPCSGDITKAPGNGGSGSGQGAGGNG